MPDERKQFDNHAERFISLALGVGCFFYTAYAQAHGIPFDAPPWLVGIILYPYGENAYEWAKDRLILRLPGAADHAKKIEDGQNRP